MDKTIRHSGDKYNNSGGSLRLSRCSKVTDIGLWHE